VRDDFDREGELGVGWQWLIGSKPAAHLRAAHSRSLRAAAISSHRSSSRGPLHHRAVVSSPKPRSIRSRSRGRVAGLMITAIGANHVALLTDGKRAGVERTARAIDESAEAPGRSPRHPCVCASACLDGNRFRFAIQDEHGAWQEIAGETDGSSFRRGIARAHGTRRNADLRARPPASTTFTATPGDEKTFYQVKTVRTRRFSPYEGLTPRSPRSQRMVFWRTSDRPLRSWRTLREAHFLAPDEQRNIAPGDARPRTSATEGTHELRQSGRVEHRRLFEAGAAGHVETTVHVVETGGAMRVGPIATLMPASATGGRLSDERSSRSGSALISKKQRLPSRAR